MIVYAKKTASKKESLSFQGQYLILSLLSIYIIGAHLRLSITSDGIILVPMYLMLFSSGALVVWFAPALWARTGAVFAVLAAFLAVQPVIGGGNNDLLDTIRSVLQLIASIGGALAVLYAASLINSAKLRRMLLALWVVIIALAVAESLFLKPIFDQIRDFLYAGSGRFVYLAEDRDLQIYGQIRPTVFASEPSFLADTLTALVLMVFMLGKKVGDIRSWGLLGLMTFVTFAVSPSFKVGFFILALLVWQFWPKNPSDTLLFLSLPAAVLVATWLTIDLFAVSLDNVGGHLATGSFFGRVGSAHLVGIDALGQYPLFGFGIGNTEGTYKVIYDVWSRTEAFSRFPWYSSYSAEHLLSNGFWWMWIYLGIIGGGIFLLLIIRILKNIGVTTAFRSVACASIVWYAGAAFVDPQSWYWVVVFSVGSMANLQTRSDRTKELSSFSNRNSPNYSF
jgi:hypothetical protein